MLNGKATIIFSTVGLIKKIQLNKMSSLPEPHIHSKNKIEVELDLFNYTTLVSTKDYNFFFGRMYFTSEDGSQNMYVYQLALDTLELKKDKGTDYGLS